MLIGVDPKVDYAFKQVFGREQNSDILCSRLNAILQPPLDQRLVSEEILNPFLDQETGGWHALSHRRAWTFSTPFAKP